MARKWTIVLAIPWYRFTRLVLHLDVLRRLRRGESARRLSVLGDVCAFSVGYALLVAHRHRNDSSRVLSCGFAACEGPRTGETRLKLGGASRCDGYGQENPQPRRFQQSSEFQKFGFVRRICNSQVLNVRNEEQPDSKLRTLSGVRRRESRLRRRSWRFRARKSPVPLRRDRSR